MSKPRSLTPPASRASDTEPLVDRKPICIGGLLAPKFRQGRARRPPEDKHYDSFSRRHLLATVAKIGVSAFASKAATGLLAARTEHALPAQVSVTARPDDGKRLAASTIAIGGKLENYDTDQISVDGKSFTATSWIGRSSTKLIEVFDKEELRSLLIAALGWIMGLADKMRTTSSQLSIGYCADRLSFASFGNSCDAPLRSALYEVNVRFTAAGRLVHAAGTSG